jgi:hypothetical protein
MPPKTPKGKLRFRRTKGEKKKNLQYPSSRLVLFFPKQYSTDAGDSQQEGQGPPPGPNSRATISSSAKGPGLAAAHADTTCHVSAPELVTGATGEYHVSYRNT